VIRRSKRQTFNLTSDHFNDPNCLCSPRSQLDASGILRDEERMCHVRRQSEVRLLLERRQGLLQGRPQALI
jgi:hypothetical protein